jgi:inosose dehydratase
MTETCRELGVQSYCFRAFKDNVRVAEMVRELDLDAIELCGIHVDFTDPSSFDDVVSIYEDAGIRIAAIGVQTMSNDPAVEECYFEFLQRAGCKFMSVDFAPGTTPEAYETASVMSEKFDVHLAIHNHGSRHWLGNSQMLEHVFSRTTARIGLCLDTAWALDSREDPIAMAETFGNRLYGLHIKDFVFDRAAAPEDVVVGTGNLDLAKLQETLTSIEFGGFVVLEYEGDVDNPVPALQACVTAVRQQMRQL